MATFIPTKALGQTAEELAANYLLAKGFTLDRRNARFGRAEVDLIVRKHDLLVFVEVKMRNNLSFGHAETFVSENQKALYHQAATLYVEEIGWLLPIRFDIMAFEKHREGIEITHFEDAF